MNLKQKLKEQIQYGCERLTTLSMDFSSISIHGVRYIAERRQHWSERIWWVFALGLSVCFCVVSIETMWMEWNKNPMTMRFAEKKVSISDIPFPTVTICPEIKTYRTKLDFVAVKKSIQQNIPLTLSEKEKARLDALSHLCEHFPNEINFQPNFTDESIYDTISNAALSLSDTFIHCTWQDKSRSCTKLFHPVLTENGLCFTFNAINSHEIYTENMAPGMMNVNQTQNITHWNIETGYQNEPTQMEYPIRVYNAEYRAGLTLSLQMFKKDLEYACHQRGLGFILILTAPGETVITMRNSFRVSLLDDIRFAVLPKITTTSNGLRNYTPNKRRCFFDAERRLHFFKIYTQNNCESECLANFTKMECGCVKFSMPRDINTKICGGLKIKCYEDASNKFYRENIGDLSSANSSKSFRNECNCLPACTSIEYDAELDHIRYHIEILEQNRNIANVSMRSRLSIFFRDHHVESMKRTEMYTRTDFLANCGGLLGLFLGGSVLSIVELIYFFTLRLFLNIRNSKLKRIVTPIDDKMKNDSSEKRF